MVSNQLWPLPYATLEPPPTDMVAEYIAGWCIPYCFFRAPPSALNVNLPVCVVICVCIGSDKTCSMLWVRGVCLSCMLDNMALGCACVRYWVNNVQVLVYTCNTSDEGDFRSECKSMGGTWSGVSFHGVVSMSSDWMDLLKGLLQMSCCVNIFE